MSALRSPRNAPAFGKPFTFRLDEMCPSLRFLRERVRVSTPSPEQVIQFYDTEYFACLKGSMVTKLRMKRIKKFLCQLTMTGCLLDVGCGTGEFMKLARKIGFNPVEGVELSPHAAEKARAKGFNVWEGAFEIIATQLPAESYDVITMLDFIEHVPDPAETLSLCQRLLKIGGWVFLHTPDYSNILSDTHLHIITKDWERVHLVYFTPIGLEAVLKRCGFQKVQVFRCPPFPPGPPLHSLHRPDLPLWRKVSKVLTWVYKWVTKSLMIKMGIYSIGGTIVAWGQKPSVK